MSDSVKLEPMVLRIVGDTIDDPAVAQAIARSRLVIWTNSRGFNEVIKNNYGPGPLLDAAWKLVAG